MFLAVDTDILLFKAATSAEVEVDWGEDIFSLWTDLKDAKSHFKRQVDHIQEKTGVSEAVFCLTDPKANFRKEVCPTYKSGRKKTRKPVGYVALVDWVKSNFPTFMKPTLEADDAMGILATLPENKGRCIIVSDDKDMLTVPSDLYRPTKDERLVVTEADADRAFLTQTMVGDVTDSYGGIYGIGPKKAEAILGSRPTWSAVEQAFIKAGMTRDDAIQQARLARILRATDYNQKKGEVILWEPPSATTNEA